MNGPGGYPSRWGVAERLAGRRARYEAPLGAREIISRILERFPHRTKLSGLWRNWNTVMGEELAGLARPLGSRKNTLLVGGGDSMAVQEISLSRGEILERANAFMDEEFFADVHVTLMLDKRPLDALTRGRTPG
jgi:hypothetical protein